MKKKLTCLFIFLLFALLCLLKLFTPYLGSPLMIYAETFNGKEYKYGWQFVNSIRYAQQHPPHLTKAKPEDLKYCKNLEEFYWLSYKELDDLSFLPDSDITHICLAGNCKDLSDLVRYKNIEILTLQDYKHDDLTYITDLSHLESLDITSSNSVDFSEIGKLKSLDRLFLSANEFDCNDLVGLDNLTYLYVSVGENNKIENVDSLLKLDSLKTLHVHSEDITEEDVQLLERHGIEVDEDF